MGDSVSPGEDLKPYSDLPITDHSELDRGGAGNVDDRTFTAVLSVGATIDDYHIHGSSVLQIRHAHNGAEWEPTVCRNCLSIIEYAAARRKFAVKAVGVVGGVSELRVENLCLLIRRNVLLTCTEHA